MHFPKPILAAIVLAFVSSTLAYSGTARNGKIAFASDRDGQSEIYLMNPDGSEQTRLTNSPAREDFPSWSPDGATIAFVRQEGETCTIFLMDSSGANIRPVPNSTSDCKSSLSWSPSGSRIAFSHYPNLYSMRLDGTDKVLLYTTTTHPFFAHMDPSWSPDGTKIAFTGPGWYNDIWTVNADGTDPIRIVNSPFTYVVVRSPHWSAWDGRIIYADVPEDMGNRELIVSVKSDGSDQQLLIRESADSLISHPSRSPDGQTLLFSKCLLLYSDGSIPVCRNQVVVSNLGTITSLGSNSNPSWQPLSANVTVSGRATTASGRGLGNVRVFLEDEGEVISVATTSAFGYFSFVDVPAGNTYTVTARAKRYTFLPQQVSTAANVTGISFIPSN